MGIATKTVGGADAQIFLAGDPSSASSLASVLSISNSQSLAGLFALLIQNVPILLNPAGTYDPAKSAPGAIGIPSVNTEGTRNTASVATTGFTPVATPTDFAGIVGSATKTVRVLRIAIGGIANAATAVATRLVVRSTANTGSTPADLTWVPHDSNNTPAISTVFRTYTTTNPTTGTLTGILRADYLNLGTAAAPPTSILVYDFTTRNGQGVVLRGVAQGLFFNWNGVALPAGTLLAMGAEISEE